ncbi:MAG: amino acid adenylation domain-containing protein [Pseudomonadota bacterium]
MDTVIEFLNTLAGRGIKLSLEEGRLNCYAQKGMLTDEIRGGIARHKPEIVALLDRVSKSQTAGGAASAETAREPEPPVGLPEEFPLSAGQNGLYIVQSLQPGMSAYNVPLCFRIRGALDPALLARAWERVLDQFPILTARIVETEAGLRHRIDPDCRTGLEVETVRFDDVAERIAFLRAQAKIPFDLNRGPLTRARLFAMGEGDAILLIVVHHIVFDGTSSVVLLRHLLEFYRRLSLGEEPRLSRAPLGYAEFVDWEARLLESAEGRGHADYWRRQLEGELPTFELLPPEGQPRVGAEFEGDTLVGELPTGLGRWIRDYCRDHGLPPSVVFLAAFRILLRRYTGLDDIVVGMPVMGRDGERFLADVGYFINMVPLRTRCDGAQSIGEFFRKVQGTMLDALYHSSYPFPRMLEALRSKPQDRASHDARNPVFQVSYAYQNFIRDDGFAELMNDIGIRVDGEHEVVQEGDFEFGLDVFENEDVFRLHLKFNPERYPRAAIGRFFGQFRILLEAIAADPQRALDDYPVLDADETTLLLDGFNDTVAEYPRERCIHAFFEERAEMQPEKVAVACGEASLTYGELLARSRALALFLQSKGVGPDVIVGLCMERGNELMVAILGTVMAGGAYLPLDPSYPDDRLTYMMEDSEATVVLTQRRFEARIAALAARPTTTVALDDDWTTVDAAAAALAADGAVLRRDVGPRHLAYVIYTSGSTGRPKGVLVEHQALVNRLVWMQRWYPIDERDVVLQKTPYSFDVSVWEFFWPMMMGASVVFAAPEGHKDVAYLERLIAAAGVTTLHFVPSMLYAYLENAGRACPTVRLVFCSGEALDKKGVDGCPTRFPNAVLHNLYGPTEAAIDVTWYDCSRLTYPFVPIGKPISNIRMLVLDERNRLQPLGVPGELHIAGDGLARGYLNRPDLTAEKFVENPHAPGTRMYKTGDLARWLPDGNIQYLGRIDNQVKIRGFRIETGEIEACLNQHPEVQDCAVIAVGQDAGKQLVAFYRARDTEGDEVVRLPNDSLREHLSQSLPDYMVPAAFVSIPAIPLSANGKVDRRALSRIDIAVASARAYVAPRTDTERTLVAIWSQVLGVAEETIGVDDGFFELGGHSLLATQAISRIRAAFRLELPLKTLFEAPSVAQMAKAISDGRAGDEGAGEASVATVATIVPADRGACERLPLSYAQERLWFIAQLEPDSAGYNIPGAVRIRGALDVDLVERSLQRIVDRHESLRTVFPSREGVAYQEILPRSEVRIERIDLSTIKARKARDAKALALCTQDAAAPFDLARGPLMRAMAIRLAADEHVLFLNMHHIVADGWSLGVMLRELSELMRATGEGREPILPALPIQYADYALWQRQRLEAGGELARQLGYWRAKLAGLTERLDLTTDFPRPAVQSFAGASHAFALDAALVGRLRAVAEREGATLFMALLAVYKALLYRYTGQDDLCVGTPVANRQYGETEPLIGMFVNTLALRTVVPVDESFPALLSRVRQTCLEAYDHQDAPFEKVVDAVQPHRDMSITPLFQTMFSLQNADRDDPLSGHEAFPLASAIAKFDLSLEFVERGGMLDGALEYCTALFSPRTAARMAEHFVALCRAIASAPETAIRRLELLGEDERRRVLGEFNRTRVDAPRDPCIQDAFERQATAEPARIALAHGDDTLGYGDLLARSRALAIRLQALGVGAGVVVGLCMERSIDAIAGLLAILQAGGACLPLDPAHPDERLAYMLDDSGAILVLTVAALSDRVDTVSGGRVRVIAVNAERDAMARAAGGKKAGRNVGKKAATKAENTPERRAGAEDPACVIYTSGSTGTPKGVAIRHRGLVNHGRFVAGQYGIGRDDVQLQVASIGFDLFLEEVFVVLGCGAKLVIEDRAVLMSPEHLHASMARHGVTALNLPTALFHQFVGAGLDMRDIRTIVVGGEALSHARARELFARWPNVRLHNTYGPTETTIISAAIEVTPALLDRHADVPIGRPIDNTRIYVLDALDRPQPIGVPGELCIAGDGVAEGYLHLPELTAEKFVEDPFAGPSASGARMYRTGDLARWLDDGALQYLGRIDTQVKIRGFRVETGEIETRLNLHPRIRDSAVVAQERAGVRQLVAFYRPESGRADAPPDVAADVPAEELRAHLLRTLPEYMVPAAFVALAEIPLNANGKVDRRALARMDVAIAAGRDRVAPRTRTERALAAIWSQVLGASEDAIGVDDDFFALGGNSLSAVRLMAKVGAEFARTLPLAILFTAPTIAALAQALSSETETSGDILVPIRAQGDLPPVFGVPGAGGNVLSLQPLARALGERRPFFGLQAAGLDGVEAPATSVEEIARSNIEAMRRAQPVGPYRIVGHSFGGAVAFEMVRQLQAQGERVATLALIDALAPAALHERDLAADDVDDLVDACAALAAANGIALEIDAARLRAEGLEQGLATIAAALAERGIDVDARQLGDFAAVYRANLRAYRDYRPRRLARGLDVVLHRAAGGVGDYGWSRLLRNRLRIRDLPADHFTILAPPHVDAIAADLSEAGGGENA